MNMTVNGEKNRKSLILHPRNPVTVESGSLNSCQHYSQYLSTCTGVLSEIGHRLVGPIDWKLTLKNL